MKNQKIVVGGNFIDLDTYEPFEKRDSKKIPAIILVPGGRGKSYVKDPNTGAHFTGYKNLASELAKQGFYAVVFDGRGQGQSEGVRSHENGVEDLQKVIDFVCELAKVDPKRIGVFGRCGGGAIALHLTQKDSRIKSIMTWGMPPSFDELDRNKIEERLMKIGIRLKKGASFLSGEEAALNIQQPLLIAGGSGDTKWFFINGVENRQLDMVKRINEQGSSREVRYVVLKGAPHGINSHDKCFNQFVKLVTGWFEDTL